MAENTENKIVKAVGGKQNLERMLKCATKIRIEVKDPEKVIMNLLQQEIHARMEEKQLVLDIGKNTEALYFSLVSAFNREETEGSRSFSYPVQKFGDVVSSVFIPIIPALVVGGLVLAIRNLLVNYFGVGMESGAAYFFTAMFEAGFWFLPVYLGYTMAVRLKLQPVLGMLMGAMLITDAYISGKIPDLFGVPVPQVDYRSSVLPIILAMIFMYYVDKLLEIIIPKILRFFLKPLLTILITAPVAFLFLGPIGAELSSVAAQGVLWISDHLGFIAQPLLCMFYPYMVLLGIDKALAPIGIEMIASMGFDPITSIMGFVSNLCVGGSALAIASGKKKKEEEARVDSLGVTALCGVTEPAMYGALIGNPRALIGTACGAAAGGLFAGITGLRTFIQGGCPGLLTFIFFIDEKGGFHYVWLALITAAIAIMVSFLSARFILLRDQKSVKEFSTGGGNS